MPEGQEASAELAHAYVAHRRAMAARRPHRVPLRHREPRREADEGPRPHAAAATRRPRGPGLREEGELLAGEDTDGHFVREELLEEVPFAFHEGRDEGQEQREEEDP